jgi:hypothetical protein
MPFAHLKQFWTFPNPMPPKESARCSVADVAAFNQPLKSTKILSARHAAAIDLVLVRFDRMKFDAAARQG